MNTNYSLVLHKKLINYIRKLKNFNKLIITKNKSKRNYFPAVVVGCELHHIKVVTACGLSNNYPPFLQNIIELRCGLIGSQKKQSNGRIYTVGCCAEQRAARDIFNKIPINQQNKKNFRNLVFTEARRPRTMQIIKYCSICKSIFK